MTTALVYADTEGAVRAWARTHPALTALVGARTFFGLPDDYDPAVKGAAITLGRIGGAPDGYSPLDNPEIQFDCWGGTKAEAAAVSVALIGALHSLSSTTAADVALLGARVTAAFFSPDTSSDPTIPRYVVTALVTARPA